jgi:hypothetical protein
MAALICELIETVRASMNASSVVSYPLALNPGPAQCPADVRRWYVGPCLE